MRLFKESKLRNSHLSIFQELGEGWTFLIDHSPHVTLQRCDIVENMSVKVRQCKGQLFLWHHIPKFIALVHMWFQYTSHLLYIKLLYKQICLRSANIQQVVYILEPHDTNTKVPSMQRSLHSLHPPYYIPPVFISPFF